MFDGDAVGGSGRDEGGLEEVGIVACAIGVQAQLVADVEGQQDVKDQHNEGQRDEDIGRDARDERCEPADGRLLALQAVKAKEVKNICCD